MCSGSLVHSDLSEVMLAFVNSLLIVAVIVLPHDTW